MFVTAQAVLVPVAAVLLLRCIWLGGAAVAAAEFGIHDAKVIHQSVGQRFLRRSQGGQAQGRKCEKRSPCCCCRHTTWYFSLALVVVVKDWKNLSVCVHIDLYVCTIVLSILAGRSDPICHGHREKNETVL